MNALFDSNRDRIIFETQISLATSVNPFPTLRHGETRINEKPMSWAKCIVHNSLQDSPWTFPHFLKNRGVGENATPLDGGRLLTQHKTAEHVIFCLHNCCTYRLQSCHLVVMKLNCGASTIVRHLRVLFFHQGFCFSRKRRNIPCPTMVKKKCICNYESRKAWLQNRRRARNFAD